MSTVTIEQLHKFHDEISKGRITRELLQAFLENPSGFTKENMFPSSTIAAKYGYTVVEDVKPSQFKVKDVKFISFFKEGDGTYITGKEMRRHAVTMKGNLGLVDGQYLLDHQEEIPKEMRGRNYIILPGTLLRDSGGDLGVAYLGWDGGQWFLRFTWIDLDFDGSGRFVCCE